MKNHRKFIIAAMFASLILLPVFANGGAGRSGEGTYDFPPEPELRYPISDKVVLTGKDFLEFRWDTSYGIDTRSYDFRLYKGYDMYQNNFIMKQSVPFDESSFKVDSSVFENGQVYTWSLKIISLAGKKSDVSFNSFVVIK